MFRDTRLGLAALIWIFAFGVSGSAGAQTTFQSLSVEEKQRRLDQAVSILREEDFHGVIAIKLGDQSPQILGFGRVLESELAPEQLQVDLLSITKTVTGAAIMKLVDQGKLSVQQPISDFFGDVPEDKRPITIHHLLTHSAGFRESLGSDDRVIGRDDYLSAAMGSKLRFEPGSSYRYSNVGFSLLAAVIELVAGKPYESFLQQDLLPANETLEIGYASVYVPELSMQTRRGRDIESASWGQPEPYWHLIGNGGLVANSQSALRFFELLVSGALLSPESTEQLFTPHQQEHPAQSFYGYGVVIDEGQRFKRFHWHNGGNDQFNSWWSYNVDHDVLLFAASSGRFDADQAAEAVLLTLLAEP